MLETYGLSLKQLKDAGIPDDPDAPVKLVTFNITVRLHVGHSGGTFQNSADFTGTSKDDCISQAIRAITDVCGGSHKQEIVECFQRK